jgi:hypothetical protein
MLVALFMVVLSTCATTDAAVGHSGGGMQAALKDSGGAVELKDSDGGTQAAPKDSSSVVELDAALKEAADYFAAQLPAGTKAAITGVDAETSTLSGYIIGELWNYLGKAGKFTMIDRQNLAAINAELIYQAGGDVQDDAEQAAQRMGHFLGAECIIYGQVSPLGSNYRLSLFASQPERGISLQQAKTVRLGPEFLPEKDLDAAIERAVTELGRNLTARTPVSMGRISYRSFESVSNFSEYLIKNIGLKAVQLGSKYQIVTNAGTAQAVIEGSFYEQNNGVAVMLQLVSANAVLGASKFTIPQSELDRNKLSVLPPNTTRSNLDKLNRAIAPYDGKNNAFKFTVTPERADAVYYNGEHLSFRIYAEKDCYFQITHVDADGKLQIIYPLYEKDNNFIKGGTTRIIPDRTFVLELEDSLGIEYQLVAAYDEQIAIVPEETDKVVVVTDESIKIGLRGEKRKNIAAGQVGIDASIEPVATARFSFTVLP